MVVAGGWGGAGEDTVADVEEEVEDCGACVVKSVGGE